jgi:hypothetical protein
MATSPETTEPEKPPGLTIIRQNAHTHRQLGPGVWQKPHFASNILTPYSTESTQIVQEVVGEDLEAASIIPPPIAGQRTKRRRSPIGFGRGMRHPRSQGTSARFPGDGRCSDDRGGNRSRSEFRVGCPDQHGPGRGDGLGWRTLHSIACDANRLPETGDGRVGNRGWLECLLREN